VTCATAPDTLSAYRWVMDALRLGQALVMLVGLTVLVALWPARES